MLQIMINSVIAIFITISCELNSVYSIKNFEKNSNAGFIRQSGETGETGIIELKNFQRPILIEQIKFIDNWCGAHCEDISRRILDKNMQPNVYDGLDSMRCHGWIDNCQYFSGKRGHNIQGSYCLTDGHLIWAKDSTSREYGTKDNCTEMFVPESKYISKYKCHTCLCTCTETSKIPKLGINWAFSLKSLESNVKDNRIITGVRLRANNKMVNWEIKEVQFNSNEEGIWISHNEDKFLKPDIDYSSLTKNSHSLSLDEIFIPSDYVITGIRFTKFPSKIKRENSILCMEVQGTKIDLITNKLMLNTSTWFNSHSAVASSSINYKLQSHLEDKSLNPKKYVTFSAKDMMFTVPYLNISDVQSEYNEPLIGIGFAYESNGGIDYIVPKIFTKKNYMNNSENITELNAIATNASTTLIKMSTIEPKPTEPDTLPLVSMEVIGPKVESMEQTTLTELIETSSRVWSPMERIMTTISTKTSTIESSMEVFDNTTKTSEWDMIKDTTITETINRMKRVYSKFENLIDSVNERNSANALSISMFFYLIVVSLIILFSGEI